MNIKHTKIRSHESLNQFRIIFPPFSKCSFFKNTIYYTFSECRLSSTPNFSWRSVFLHVSLSIFLSHSFLITAPAIYTRVCTSDRPQAPCLRLSWFSMSHWRLYRITMQSSSGTPCWNVKDVTLQCKSSLFHKVCLGLLILCDDTATTHPTHVPTPPAYDLKHTRKRRPVPRSVFQPRDFSSPGSNKITNRRWLDARSGQAGAKVLPDWLI